MTPELLRQLLDYNPITGSLTWCERPESMFRDGDEIAEILIGHLFRLQAMARDALTTPGQTGA